MLKKLLVILLLSIISCRKPVIDEQLERAKQQATTEATGVYDNNRTPDLVPVKLQTAYEGYPIGILSQPPQLYLNFFHDNETANWIRFDCPVENIGVPSTNPWSPLVYTGTDYGGADFVWPSVITDTNFLQIVVFQNGLPISNYYKAATNASGWSGVDEDHIYNYNPALDNRTYLTYSYPGFSGVFHPMFLDNYFNWVELNQNPSGKYALVVTYNQESYVTHQRLFRENRYDNNTTSVGFNITGSSVAWDESALAENRPIAVSNLIGKLNHKLKGVRFDWTCPYHGTGVVHKFRIKRDGAVIADDLWNEGYTDTTAKMPFRGATYSVEIKIEGLGISPASQVTVTK